MALSIAILMILSTIVAPFEETVLTTDEPILEEIDTGGDSFAISNQRSQSENVRLSELLYDPYGSDMGKEIVAIRNFDTELVDISGWRILNEEKITLYQFPESYTLLPLTSTYIHLEKAGLDTAADGVEAGARELFGVTTTRVTGFSSLTGVLPNDSGSVGLYTADTSADEIVDYVRWGATASGNSGSLADAIDADIWGESSHVDVQNLPEGRGIAAIDPYFNHEQYEWGSFNGGSENSVVINEISLTADEVSNIQWVELFNPGPGLQQLAGWELSNSTGSLFEFDHSSTILPNEFLVIRLEGNSKSEIGPSPLRNLLNERFYNPDQITKNPLDASSDLLALVSTTVGGSDGIIDFVAWGEAQDSSLAQAAESDGNWVPNNFVDVSELADEDSIGRDRASSDSDSALDWAVDGGTSANGPTSGYMNMFRLEMTPSDNWGSGEHTIQLKNLGTSLDISGWQLSNLFQDSSIVIPNGIVIPENSTLELRFEDGIDDTDFSDGSGSLHLGDLFEIKSLGVDAIFFHSSDDVIEDLVGALLFIDGELIESESEGLGRWFHVGFLDWVMATVEEGIEWLKEKWGSFVNWLAEVGKALIEAAWNALVGTFKDWVFDSGILDSVIQIDYDDDPAEEHIEWVLTISPGTSFEGNDDEIDANLGWWLDFEGDDITITKYCTGVIALDGSLSITLNFGFDFDIEIASITATTSIGVNIDASSDVELTKSEGVETSAEINLVLFWTYEVSASLFGENEHILGPKTVPLFSFTWDTGLLMEVDSDTCLFIMDDQQSEMWDDLPDKAQINPGSYSVMDAATKSTWVSPEDDIILEMGINQFANPTVLVEDDMGWLNGTTAYELEDGEMYSDFEINVAIPPLEELDFAEQIFFDSSDLDSSDLRCGCNRTGTAVEVYVSQLGESLTDQVTVSTTEASEPYTDAMMELSIVVPELYVISVSSESDWGVEVIGSNPRPIFPYGEDESMFLIRTYPPPLTPIGTTTKIQVSIQSLYNAENNIEFDVESEYTNAPATMKFGDFSAQNTDPDWTTSGNWVHGEPSQPDDIDFNVWSSNPSGEPNAQWSILSSPVRDLSNDLMASIEFGEWTNIPDSIGYWPSMVTASDLDTGEIWILEMRGGNYSGGWIDTRIFLTDDMMNERTQIQFHYFTPIIDGVRQYIDSFWMIKNLFIYICNNEYFYEGQSSSTRPTNPSQIPEIEFENRDVATINGMDIEMHLERSDDLLIFETNFEQGVDDWMSTSRGRSQDSGWEFRSEDLVSRVGYTEAEGTFDVNDALRGEFSHGRDAQSDTVRSVSMNTIKGKLFYMDLSNIGGDKFLSSPEFDLSGYTESDNLFVRMDIGMSDGIREKDVIPYFSDDTRDFTSVGALNEHKLNSSTYWGGYDDLGWIRWVSIEIPVSDFVSGNTKFGLLYDSSKRYQNGEMLLFDNFELFSRTTTVVASSNRTIDLDPGERRTISLDYTSDETSTGRYDLRVREQTDSRSVETTYRYTRSIGPSISLDESLNMVSVSNGVPLALSANMGSSGLVDYYLTDSRGDKSLLGSSTSSPNAPVSADVSSYEGEYTLTAIMTDFSGRQVADYTTIRFVNNPPPMALIEYPTGKILQGDVLTLSGLGSTDDGQIQQYQWRISGPEELNFDTAEISFTPAFEGVYNVRLVVFDEMGLTGILEETFTVSNSSDTTTDDSGTDGDDSQGDSASLSEIGSNKILAFIALIVLLGVLLVRNRSRQDADD